MKNQTLLQCRHVSDFGETLVVRDRCGGKVLTDPLDENVTVFVPVGRLACLVGYTFGGSCYGRDSHVVVFKNSDRLGFFLAGRPQVRVLLQDLVEGQHVDVFPAVEPAAVYARLPRPLPVLYGASAAEPIYSVVLR